MDLGSKKEALRKLTNAKHLEADKALLKEKKPDSYVFKRKWPTNERAQRETLWELLSVVKPEDIEANRKKLSKPEPEKPSAEEIEKQKAAEVAAAIDELNGLNLDEKQNYQAVKKLAATLELKPKSQEAVNIIEALKEFKALQEEKTDEGTGTENTEVDNTEELKSENETVKAENEELKEELEEKDDELEEIKEELEETQEKLKDAEAAIDESKKNSPEPN